MITQTETIKIWGLEFQPLYVDGMLWWEITNLQNPFQLADHKYRVSIGEKAIREARKAGVSKFVWKGRLIDLPSEAILKQKIKNKHYELKKSLFSGAPDMILYYFLVN